MSNLIDFFSIEMLLLLWFYTWWKESWILSQFFLEIISKGNAELLGVSSTPMTTYAVGCLLCLLRLVNVGVPPSVSHKHLKANWDMKSHLHTSALTMVEIIPKKSHFDQKFFHSQSLIADSFKEFSKNFICVFGQK